MAASFLQYCAMCEKQIMTPSNSILYCSQACRRKDDAKPLSASVLPSPRDTPRSSASLSRSSSPKAKTAASPMGSPTPTVQIPAELHTHKADLDPTEWKPKLRVANTKRSEAYRYLASFHVGGRSLGEGEFEHEKRIGRPGLHQHSASMFNLPTLTPSLDSTATTAASSYDGFEYDFHTRPLQSRQNPIYALSTCLKNDELVTPHIPPPAVAVVEPLVSEESLWEKKIVSKGAVGEKEGLGRLFSGEAA